MPTGEIDSFIDDLDEVLTSGYAIEETDSEVRVIARGPWSLAFAYRQAIKAANWPRQAQSLEMAHEGDERTTDADVR